VTTRITSDETIAAVLVTHNRVDHLRRGVDALLSEPVDHLVVVDNCSTDGTAAYLASVGDRRVHVVRSEVNLGGAGGFELGMRRATRLDPDWYLLLDDDARPRPGAVTEFRRRRFDADVGGVGAAVYAPDGAIAEINRPGLNPFTRRGGIIDALLRGRSSFHVPDDAYRAAEVDADCIGFVGYFVRGDLVKGPLGYPPGDFFIYADDQSYSFRVRRLGMRNLFVPAIEFIHDTDTYARAGVVSPVWKVFYLTRNNMRFYREISGRWYPLVVPFKILAWAARMRRYDQKRRYLRLLGAGISDGIAGRFDRPHERVVALANGAIGSGP
jgi:GT2 family glycosyltransferase